DALLHRCASRLPPPLVIYRMEGFVKRHKGHMVSATPEQVAFQVPLADRPAARTALGVTVQLQDPTARTASGLTVIAIELRALGCERDQVDWVLREIGPMLLEALRGD